MITESVPLDTAAIRNRTNGEIIHTLILMKSFAQFAYIFILLLALTRTPDDLYAGAVRQLGSSAGGITPVAGTVATLPPHDDVAYNGDILTAPVKVNIGFCINFHGIATSELWVNNNGNVTFVDKLIDWTPESLEGKFGIIAPYWGDVDTRTHGEVSYGRGNLVGTGESVFFVTWNEVGYFDFHDEKLNTFQLVLIDRSASTGRGGNFDIEFNYDQIRWEIGRADDTNDISDTDGVGAPSARAGYGQDDGTGNKVLFELPGSAITHQFLDFKLNGQVNPDGLIHGRLNSSVDGRYVMPIYNTHGLISVSGRSQAFENGAPGVFRVSRTGPTNADVVINYGASTPGYIGEGYPPGTVTILRGHSFADFSVAAENDWFFSYYRTLCVTLIDGTCGGIVQGGNACVQIIDDDLEDDPYYQGSEYRVYWSIAKLRDAAEGGQSGQLLVTRKVLGPTIVPVSQYSYASANLRRWGGSAGFYDLNVPFGVEIPQGVASVIVDVPAINDTLSELTEYFDFEIYPTFGHYVEPGGSVARLQVFDNDLPGPLLVGAPSFWNYGPFQFPLSGGGPIGSCMTIESSDDLIDWSVDRTLIIEESYMAYADPIGSARSRRFYRARTAGAYGNTAVGFYRVTIPGRTGTSGGYGLVAIHLNHPVNNTVANIFAGVPSGTEVLTLNAQGNLVPNLFDGNFWGWGAAPLTPGQAVFVRNPATTPLTITLYGVVPEGQIPQSISPGYSLRSSCVPQAGNLVNFQIPPVDGDAVNPWNPITQEMGGAFSYFNGYGWADDNVNPNAGNFAIGEGFYLNTQAAKSWTRSFSVWAQKLKAVGFAGNEFLMQLDGGKAGTSVQIQSSSDAVNWINFISFNEADASTSFSDESASGASARFYRASNSLGRAYSAVGFYRVTIPGRTGVNGDIGGYKLVAVQLKHPQGNTVANLFAGVPASTEVSTLNAYGQLVPNTFNGTSWTHGSKIISPGQAVLVRNPGTSDRLLTFFGTIPEGRIEQTILPGYSLIGSCVPRAGNLVNFQIPPVDGDAVNPWNVAAQEMGGALSYFNGYGWADDNLNPNAGNFAIGEGFYLNTQAAKSWIRSFLVW
jgi:hypothetical protein